MVEDKFLVRVLCDGLRCSESREGHGVVPLQIERSQLRRCGVLEGFLLVSSR